MKLATPNSMLPKIIVIEIKMSYSYPILIAGILNSEASVLKMLRKPVKGSKSPRSDFLTVKPGIIKSSLSVACGNM